jgi:predicted PurR-regulated permease PerM
MSAQPAPPPPWHAGWVGRGLLAIAIVFLLQQAQPLLLPMASAVVLTFVLAPAVRWLRRRGLPEYVGAAVLVVTLLGGTTLVGSALIEPAAQWWERAPSAIARLLDRFDELRRSVPLLAPPPPPAASEAASAPSTPRARQSRPRGIDIHVADPPPPPRDPLKERIASEGLALTGAVLGRALSVGLSLAATVILLYFLLASEHWMLVRTVEAIPRRRTRALVLCGVRAAQREIATFIASLAVINLGVGLCTTLAMAWIGLPNPVLWGTVAGVLNFIPYLGPLMIVGLLLLAGLISFGPDLMLAPALAFLLIHAIESNLVSPWFVGRRLALSPLSVFLSVMFWGWLWGIAGALIAVPLLVGIRSVCKRNRRLRLVAIYLEGNDRDSPSLRSLIRIRRRPPGAAVEARGKRAGG